MRNRLRRLSITLLSVAFALPASAQLLDNTLDQPAARPGLGADILTDTLGANLNPYMQHLIAGIMTHWHPASQVAQQESSTPQETLITLTIAPDGHLSAMRLEASAKDPALAHAAWNAAKDSAYAPLPTAMEGSSLTLRLHFRAN